MIKFNAHILYWKYIRLFKVPRWYYRQTMPVKCIFPKCCLILLYITCHHWTIPIQYYLCYIQINLLLPVGILVHHRTRYSRYLNSDFRLLWLFDDILFFLGNYIGLNLLALFEISLTSIGRIWFPIPKTTICWSHTPHCYNKSNVDFIYLV